MKSTEVLNARRKCGSICMVDVGCRIVPFSSYMFTFLMRQCILIWGMYYGNILCRCMGAAHFSTGGICGLYIASYYIHYRILW